MWWPHKRGFPTRLKEPLHFVDRVQRLFLDLDREFGVRPRIVVDEIGVGGGLLDRLKEIGYRAYGYNGGRRPKDTERYLNRRAEDFWHLREKLEGGTLAIPPDEELRREMVALSWTPTGAGQVQIMSKIELRGLIGRSPDRLDALCMAAAPSRLKSAVWGSRRRTPSVVYRRRP